MCTHTDAEARGGHNFLNCFSTLCFEKGSIAEPGAHDSSGICLSTLPSALGLPLWTFYIDAGDPNSHPEAYTRPRPSLTELSPLLSSPF